VGEGGGRCSQPLSRLLWPQPRGIAAAGHHELPVLGLCFAPEIKMSSHCRRLIRTTSPCDPP